VHTALGVFDNRQHEDAVLRKQRVQHGGDSAASIKQLIMSQIARVAVAMTEASTFRWRGFMATTSSAS
jgi:hypothetical protein